ncbi:MAG TPA: hypothetical protein VHN14_26980, partial [Kofleriaceae bacterium]|nr:hypothetical protein [Kofleriaceae bacterium]
MTKHSLRWLVWSVAVVTWFATPRHVHAEGSNTEVLLQVKAPDKNNPKTKDDAPQIEATVIGAPTLPPEKFVLSDASSKQPIDIKASSKRDYNQGNETLAIAIVMSGWQVWIGNEDVVADESARYPGVLKSLSAALDTLSFKDAGPPGSLGTVIIYADKAFPRIPMGPLANITGSALGTQADYKGTTGVELVKGIELALAELHKVQAVRKVLIVIGDGRDANPESAKGQLANLKKQAAQDQIQTFGIIYRTVLSDVGDGAGAPVVGQMIQQTSVVNSADNIATTVKNILGRMADRQYFTFPGFDPKAGVGFSWDGKPHNLMLKIDNKDAIDEPISIVLRPIWNQSKPGFPWLILILVVVGAILLLIIGVKVFSSKPAPMPMPVAPVAVAEPPKPAGPMKTVMIGAGGDEGGFPIVGWLVPLNGVQ